MLDSVLVARDRFLKPDGALYPSHARIIMAPIWTNNEQNHRMRDYHSSVAGWGGFAQDMQEQYGVDMAVLTSSYEKEQRDYFLNTAQWVDTHPEQLMGPPRVVKEYDLKTLSLEELKAPLKCSTTFGFDVEGRVEAMLGWFDVDFKGSPEHPAYQPINLPTGPDATGATHWGQQAFYLSPGISAKDGAHIEGRLEMRRKKENQRLYDVRLTWRQGDGGEKINESVGERRNVWHIE